MPDSDTKERARRDEAGTPATANRAQRSVTDLFEVRVAMFEVPSSDSDRIARAAEELAEYVRAHEPRTRFFGVLQDEDCPARFVYAAVFDDEEAECTHRASAPARRFAAALLTAGVRLESGRWTAVAGL